MGSSLRSRNNPTLTIIKRPFDVCITPTSILGCDGTAKPRLRASPEREIKRYALDYREEAMLCNSAPEAPGEDSLAEEAPFFTPHRCLFCRKKFTFYYGLNVHVKTRHEVTPGASAWLEASKVVDEAFGPDQVCRPQDGGPNKSESLPSTLVTQAQAPALTRALSSGNPLCTGLPTLTPATTQPAMSASPEMDPVTMCSSDLALNVPSLFSSSPATTSAWFRSPIMTSALPQGRRFTTATQEPPPKPTLTQTPNTVSPESQHPHMNSTLPQSQSELSVGQPEFSKTTDNFDGTIDSTVTSLPHTPRVIYSGRHNLTGGYQNRFGTSAGPRQPQAPKPVPQTQIAPSTQSQAQPLKSVRAQTSLPWQVTNAPSTCSEFQTIAISPNGNISMPSRRPNVSKRTRVPRTDTCGSGDIVNGLVTSPPSARHSAPYQRKRGRPCIQDAFSLAPAVAQALPSVEDCSASGFACSLILWPQDAQPVDFSVRARESFQEPTVYTFQSRRAHYWENGGLDDPLGAADVITF